MTDRLDHDATTPATECETAPSEAVILAKGTVVDRYIVSDLIGEGGMGVVYRAFDPELNRPVALKLLHIGRGSSDDSLDVSQRRARMQREAQALAQLSHPNVVAVHDVGTYAGGVFMAMEYVEGKTLRDYLAEGGHTRGEVLEVLLAAGRGLAAAHQVGIVHRDFKPANVVIGEDGRVRVVDFGLAKSEQAASTFRHDEPLPEELFGPGELEEIREAERAEAADKKRPHVAGGLLAESFTRADAITGTPHYMAPEQVVSKVADAKSDQFAFCVVAFEALWGSRPFAGRSLRELFQGIAEGRIERRPERGDAVPGWLDRVVVRGLSASPGERYGSMEELLEALQADPAIERARRRARAVRWAVGALVMVLAGSTAFGVWYGVTSGKRKCRGYATRLAGVWDDGMREKVRTAFLKVDRPYAEDTFERTAGILDRYAEGWILERTEACEATHVRGEQSEGRLDRRMGCLDHRLAELAALVRVFGKEPDPEVLKNAIPAATKLAKVESCGDPAVLDAAVPPPEDPAVRTEVERVRGVLAEVKALEDAGKYEEGLSLAQVALERARTTHYRALEGEALLRVGRILEDMGKYQEAEHGLQDAARTALEAKDWYTAVQAVIQETKVVGEDQARCDAGLSLRRLVETMLALGPEEATIQAEWSYCLGAVFSTQGKYDLAIEHLQQARAVWERVLGDSHPRVSSVLGSLALVYYRQGKYPEAKEHYRQALAIAERVLGPDHPDVVLPLNGLGLVQVEQREYEEAKNTYQRALAVSQRALGPDHPDVSYPLYNLGNVYYYQKNYDQALRYYTEALDLRKKTLGPDHPKVAYPISGLGWVYYRTGQLDKAREQFETVLRIRQKALGPDHPDVADPIFLLGELAAEGKQYDEAIGFYQRALSIWTGALGPRHRNVAQPHLGLAGVFLRTGQLDRAAAHFENARAVIEAAMGPQDPGMVAPLTGLGESHLRMGRPQRAEAFFRRALDLCGKDRSDPRSCAMARFGTARILAGRSRGHPEQRREALHLARTALRELKQEAGCEEEAGRVESWIQQAF